ncbi:SDR family NAD(P)-dependent oxidoreductase [Pendulispora albinea]|uniref:SDR family oxidoreductase n=1 Tax=Pendulispora albinea TaxID=2741071 RepID=A0ABZ2LWQ0_9BACT
MIDLAGRGVLLTGTRRIGAVVAKRLAREGAVLALAYRSSRTEAELLANEVSAGGHGVALLQGDLTVEADVVHLLGAARAALGGLFGIVHMASGFSAAPLDSLDLATWERDMADARSSFLLAAHGSRLLREGAGETAGGQTRGHIVFCTDWAAGATPYRGFLPYLTAKASVDFMTRAFAVELAPHGILVNAVAPGPMRRPVDMAPAEWTTLVQNDTPLTRESSPDDLAEMVVTLLRAETITGEIIRIDSGRHLAGSGAS